MIDLDSQQWIRALREGLGAEVSRVGTGTGLMVCFEAGPFRAAYPDFLIGSAGLTADWVASQIDAAHSLGADLIRIQADAPVDDSRVFARHDLGSMAIEHLAAWSERGADKSRRAANRLARSALLIRRGRAGDGARLYGLYRATLHRHGGSVRYTERYFEAIAPYAAWVAELDGRVCAFVCVGHRGSRGCYMHGAHDPSVRGHYPSDQLFLLMLRAARDAGLESFDFLPSPATQGSLSAYKAAWGGQPVQLVVSDLALRPVRARAFAAALKLSRGLSAIRSRVFGG
ncbi:GNAT family N-acetyltransferase [Lysobacter sp. Hz 25]|uniref:GNAT family N-acetyltransferase n=1 Tax=Lysobacter sp. Hz 25 TaxID=3383698 RepID=UPI0038D373A3